MHDDFAANDKPHWCPLCEARLKVPAVPPWNGEAELAVAGHFAGACSGIRFFAGEPT